MQHTERVTIRDVAAAAGVSVATVSKVLNGRYGVAEATGAKVRAVIEELGYEASLVAQSLRNRRTNVVGVLVPDIEPFTAELLMGASEAIRGSGYELVVYSAGGLDRERDGWERRYLSRLSGTLIDGAVLVTPTVLADGYAAPVVAVDPYARNPAIPTIDSDNAHGARVAVEHLLALGHRRVALLAGRPELDSAREREQGYRQAMAAAGLAVEPELVAIGDFQPGPSHAAARHLLSLERRPSAIFAANDLSALAALEVAAELGLRVPEDLSVVGFDNLPESALSRPELTTVDQQVRQMGRRAVEVLLALIAGAPADRENPDLTRHTLATRLVVRRSTARLDPAVPDTSSSADDDEGRQS